MRWEGVSSGGDESRKGGVAPDGMGWDGMRAGGRCMAGLSALSGGGRKGKARGVCNLSRARERAWTCVSCQRGITNGVGSEK